MMLGHRKRNRRKPERNGRSFSLAWLKPVLAGGLQSALGVAGMMIGLGIMLWGLALAFDRPIGQVEVGGQFQRVAPVQIEEMVAPFRGAGFLSVDLDALRAALESIPWVDRARVERRWPNGVRVFMRPAAPQRATATCSVMNTRTPFGQRRSTRARSTHGMLSSAARSAPRSTDRNPAPRNGATTSSICTGATR